MENKKIKELNQAVRTIKENCGNFNSPCEGCYFKKDGRCSLQNQPPIWWEGVKEPYKITELEKQLLIHFKNKGAEYIARNKDKFLFLYTEKPFKVTECGYWDDRTDTIIDLFVLSDLFTFVSWEEDEPMKIDDVLENCVVVE